MLSRIAQKLRTSWEVLNISISILLEKPKLLLFGVISTVFAFLYLAAVTSTGFFTFFASTAVSAGDMNKTTAIIIAIVFGALFLIGAVFIVVLFNTALCHNILKQIKNENVPILTSIKFSWGKRKLIFQWSLFSMTVSLIIMMIQGFIEKADEIPFVGKLIGSIITRIAGVAWGLATFFVVPVIVNEDLKIKDVLNKSVSMVKKTWGEQIIMGVGFNLFGTALSLIIGILLVLLFRFVPALSNPFYTGNIDGMFTVIITMVAVWVFATVLITYVMSVLWEIFVANLYIYAVEGVVPAKFNEELLNRVWIVKK